MDYEKKYKEAIERAKIWQEHLYDVNDKDYADELNYIFPELAESEDERMKKAIIATIHLYYGEPLEDEAKEMIAWLEKQCEKEKFIKKELGCIQGYREEAIRRLHELEKQEWREKDEYNKRQVCRILIDAGCSQKLQDKINSWLESFRFQPHWKPSDEQIMALRWVLNNIPYDSHKEEISGLLEQLKKLKEE